jgi:hypothetical protein
MIFTAAKHFKELAARGWQLLGNDSHNLEEGLVAAMGLS